MLFTQGRLLTNRCTCLPVSACILAVSTVRSVLALGLLEVSFHSILLAVSFTPFCLQLVNHSILLAVSKPSSIKDWLLQG